MSAPGSHGTARAVHVEQPGSPSSSTSGPEQHVISSSAKVESASSEETNDKTTAAVDGYASYRDIFRDNAHITYSNVQSIARYLGDIDPFHGVVGADIHFDCYEYVSGHIFNVSTALEATTDYFSLPEPTSPSATSPAFIVGEWSRIIGDLAADDEAGEAPDEQTQQSAFPYPAAADQSSFMGL